MSTREELARLKSQAAAMRAEGKTYRVIAQAVGRDERTVMYWLAGKQIKPKPAGPLLDDRQWPTDWTIDWLADLFPTGFHREEWEQNLALIRSAEAQGNVYIPWVFRRLIELAQRKPMPDGSLSWSLAIASLPPLGDWLDSAAFGDLAVIVETSEPWNGEKEHARYTRRATIPAAAIKQRLFEAQAQVTMGKLFKGGLGLTPAPILFAALSERVPQFDRTRRFSLYRILPLVSIIMGLLALPKEKLP